MSPALALAPSHEDAVLPFDLRLDRLELQAHSGHHHSFGNSSISLSPPSSSDGDSGSGGGSHPSGGSGGGRDSGGSHGSHGSHGGPDRVAVARAGRAARGHGRTPRQRAYHEQRARDRASSRTNPFNYKPKTTPNWRNRWSHVYTPGYQSGVHTQYEVALPLEAGVNWVSLCTPAILPVTTAFEPKELDLQQKYLEYSYVTSNIGFEDDDGPEPLDAYRDLAKLLQELVCQRLLHDFQIIKPDASAALSSRGRSVSTVLESPHRQPCGQTSYFMSKGNYYHRLTLVSNDQIQVLFCVCVAEDVQRCKCESPVHTALLTREHLGEAFRLASNRLRAASDIRFSDGTCWSLLATVR
jgi:hypothetical protein